jgi:hypothetical protein
MHVPMQDLGYAHSAPWEVTLPEDVVRREDNRAYSERLWAQRQRTSGGDDEEEDEDGEEWEVTPPPQSPPPEDLPSFGGIFSQQVGISIGACQSRWPQTKTRSFTDPSL